MLSTHYSLMIEKYQPPQTVPNEPLSGYLLERPSFKRSDSLPSVSEEKPCTFQDLDASYTLDTAECPARNHQRRQSVPIRFQAPRVVDDDSE